jgi:hypothetical protein
MARVIQDESVRRTRPKAWLRLAAKVTRTSAPVEVYRHLPDANASAEHIRERAGSIRLGGLAPSWKFLQDDEDAGAG